MSTLFASGATIGAFFAGFTLNIVVSVDASEKPEVRLFAAIASLFFVLLVLLSSLSNVVFTYYKLEFLDIMIGIHSKHSGERKFTKQWVRDRWKAWHLWSMFGILPSLLLGGLSAGVYFFFLIMRAYEPDVAFAGLAAIGMGTVFGGIGWLGLLFSYTPQGQRLSSGKGP